MNLAADFELQELWQMFLSSGFDYLRVVAGVDQSLVGLVAVVMIASLGAPADVQLHGLPSQRVPAALAPTVGREVPSCGRSRTLLYQAIVFLGGDRGGRHLGVDLALVGGEGCGPFRAIMTCNTFAIEVDI
jgi:hypothetical protein